MKRSLNGRNMHRTQQARRERDERASEVYELQGRLQDAKITAERLRAEILALEDHAKTLTAELDAANEQLRVQRQQWGHDISGADARLKSLLERRLSPLINDAIDAVEIGQPDIALERLVDARSVISKEIL